jgi:Minor capsid.
MPVRIEISPNKVQVKITGAFGKGLFALSSEILGDCNEYCKYDTGALVMSSWIHSQLDKGLLIWQTPYAKRQYYEIQTAIKDTNDKASWKWCEAAAAEHKDRWNRLAQKALGDNL